jgi:hypothetical protein
MISRPKEATYLQRIGAGLRRRSWNTTMAQTGRLQHDVEVAQRATVGVTVGLVFVAFVLLALGAAVFDIGKWLSAW